MTKCFSLTRGLRLLFAMQAALLVVTYQVAIAAADTAAIGNAIGNAIADRPYSTCEQLHHDKLGIPLADLRLLGVACDDNAGKETIQDAHTKWTELFHARNARWVAPGSFGLQGGIGTIALCDCDNCSETKVDAHDFWEKYYRETVAGVDIKNNFRKDVKCSNVCIAETVGVMFPEAKGRISQEDIEFMRKEAVFNRFNDYNEYFREIATYESTHVGGITWETKKFLWAHRKTTGWSDAGVVNRLVWQNNLRWMERKWENKILPKLDKNEITVDSEEITQHVAEKQRLEAQWNHMEEEQDWWSSKNRFGCEGSVAAPVAEDCRAKNMYLSKGSGTKMVETTKVTVHSHDVHYYQATLDDPHFVPRCETCPAGKFVNYWGTGCNKLGEHGMCECGNCSHDISQVDNSIWLGVDEIKGKLECTKLCYPEMSVSDVKGAYGLIRKGYNNDELKLSDDIEKEHEFVKVPGISTTSRYQGSQRIFLQLASLMHTKDWAKSEKVTYSYENGTRNEEQIFQNDWPRKSDWSKYRCLANFEIQEADVTNFEASDYKGEYPYEAVYHLQEGGKFSKAGKTFSNTYVAGKTFKEFGYHNDSTPQKCKAADKYSSKVYTFLGVSVSEGFPGATATDECKQCPSGSIVNNKGTACDDLAPRKCKANNMYSDPTTTDECNTCPHGKFVNYWGTGCNDLGEHGLCECDNCSHDMSRVDNSIWLGVKEVKDKLECTKLCYPESTGGKITPVAQDDPATLRHGCILQGEADLIAEAKKLAMSLNLQIGNSKYPFAGPYTTKGLYAYNSFSSKYKGVAFYGAGGYSTIVSDMETSLADPKYRPFSSLPSAAAPLLAASLSAAPLSTALRSQPSDANQKKEGEVLMPIYVLIAMVALLLLLAPIAVVVYHLFGRSKPTGEKPTIDSLEKACADMKCADQITKMDVEMGSR